MALRGSMTAAAEAMAVRGPNQPLSIMECATLTECMRGRICIATPAQMMAQM
jgi:hypothetical protein